jgi:hypothetical protein
MTELAGDIAPSGLTTFQQINIQQIDMSNGPRRPGDGLAAFEADIPRDYIH